MTKLKLLIAACALILGAATGHAKTDVTATYLKDADLASLNGWGNPGNTAWNTTGAVNVVEFWNWSSQFNFSQTANLHAGYYRLAVNAFYRNGGSGDGTNNNMAWIFAGEKKQNVVALKSMNDLSGYAGSNDLYRAATAFSLGKFSNEFDFKVTGEGTVAVEIGFRGTCPNNGWCILGPVTLYEYTAADYIEDYREKVGIATPLLSEKMNASVLQALQAAIVEESTLTTVDAVQNAVTTLTEAIANANTSIAYYEQLKAVVDYYNENYDKLDDAGKAAADAAGAPGALAAYTNGTATDGATEKATLNAAYRAGVLATSQPGDGLDMTAFITNPDYEQDELGWTVEAAAGDGPNGRQGNVRPGGSATNHCYEAWNNSSFDIYQIVNQAPKGVYEIQVQGFYRYGRDNAWTDYNKQLVDYVKPSGVPVYVYMNKNATNFVNIFGDPKQITDESFYSNGSNDYNSEAKDGVTYYFPNGMASAAIAFSDGMYKQSAYGLVAKDGDVLRLGVKGNSNQLGDSWVIWDDFKLIYRGFKPEVIKPVLEEAIADVKENYFGLLMGKTEFAAFTKAIANGEQAIKDNDGEAMFAALTALYDAKDPALLSKDNFINQEIPAEVTKLTEALESYVETKLYTGTRKAAEDLLNGIKGNTIYENDETDQLKSDVAKAIDNLANSAQLYSDLKLAIDRLNEAITKAGTIGIDENLIEEGVTMLSENTAKYNAGSIADSAIPDAITIINAKIKQLNTVNLSEESTKIPVNAEDVTVKLKRTINQGEWSTICLPFAMSQSQMESVFGSNVQLASFAGYEATKNAQDQVTAIAVNFMDATSIEPNKPYIIKATKNVTEIDLDNVTIDAREAVTAAVERTSTQWSEMIGNYVAGTTLKANTLFLSGGMFWYSAGKTIMNGFRAYFDFSDVLDVKNLAGSRIKIAFNEETTGIQTVGIVEDNMGNVFDLQGRRVEKPAKSGLYIKNGKKVIIK